MFSTGYCSVLQLNDIEYQYLVQYYVFEEILIKEVIKKNHCP